MYKNKIILTYRALLETHEELMERIINVGMTGQYAEINSCFEEGDSFEFDPEMFRDTKDQNLLLLFELFDKLEETMNSLANMNGITEEELNDNCDEEEDL